MATEWLYSRDGIQHGPVSPSQLRVLAETDKLLPSDLVWREGLPQWVPAGKVQGLFVQSSPPLSSKPVMAPPLPTTMAPIIAGKVTATQTPKLPPGWKDVIATRKSQIVLIEHGEGLGAGLLVSSDGVIVTNKHIIDGSDFVQISFSNNTATKGAVLHIHPNTDLAIVKAAVQGADYMDILKDSTDSIEAGEEIIAIGHPHGHRFTSTRGIVSVVRQRVGQEYYLQHDVAINPGNSGGPLIDQFGNLIGINTFVRRDSQGLGFAIPATIVQTYVSAIVDAIRKGHLQTPTDEEILEAQAEITPEDALHAAVMSFEREPEELENGGFLLRTLEGYIVGVWIRDQTLECVSNVAELNSSAVDDADLLRQILEINHSLEQSKFCLDADSELWIVARRFTTGMDAVEAHSLIASVMFTADKYTESIQKFLEDNYPDDEGDEP